MSQNSRRPSESAFESSQQSLSIPLIIKRWSANILEALILSTEKYSIIIKHKSI